MAVNVTSSSITPELWESHTIVAPNEYSDGMIGIHNCLVRENEYDDMSALFYKFNPIVRGIDHCIQQLKNPKQMLKNDSETHIERYAMITRLIYQLENETYKHLIEDKFKKIKSDLIKSMHDKSSQIPKPESIEDLLGYCMQRNDYANQLNEVYRKRRFQFYSIDELCAPINIITLQIWTQYLFENITMIMAQSEFQQHPQFIQCLDELLKNSFIIVQQPTLPIATKPTGKSSSFTVKSKLRLLYLLDKENPLITIDKSKCFVCCSTDETICCEQPDLIWQTKPILTSSKTHRNFSSIDLSNITFNKTSSSTSIYYLKFQFHVIVRSHQGLTLHETDIDIKSAPFGLVTNVSQSADLFEELFIADLTECKTMIAKRTGTITNLTFTELIESIKRYFIYRTGIHPNPWVMPYISKELVLVSGQEQNSNNENFETINFNNEKFKITLAKILAQIDYMAHHSILSFFHADGLFLGVYGSTSIDNLLNQERNRSQSCICVLRFGSIHNMPDAKSVGVRLEVAPKSESRILRAAFRNSQFAGEIGTFIIRTASEMKPQFQKILTNFTVANEQMHNAFWSNIHELTIHYNNSKLKELCPYKSGYDSIWVAYSIKNEASSDPNSPTQPALTYNSNPHVPLNEQPQAQQQVSTEYSPANQNPIIIVVNTFADQHTITEDNLLQIVSNSLPQYSSQLLTAPIFTINCVPQSVQTNSDFQ